LAKRPFSETMTFIDKDKESLLTDPRTRIIPLESECRTNLRTAEAAFHLNRAPQTLRLWAMCENEPIRPIRVNGRLAWPVAELRRVLQVPAAA
jgi:hypothetical protein